MSEQDIFIGREKELQMIKEMIFDPTGNRHFLRIVGRGGVGKTWLFRKITEIYKKDPRVLVLNVDFSEIRFRSFHRLILILMEQIKQKLIQSELYGFLEKLSGLQQIVLSTSEDDFETGQAKIDQFSVSLIGELSKLYRIVVIADTVEGDSLVPPGPTEGIERINSIAAQFPNAVLIYGSRSNEYINYLHQRLLQYYRDWEIHAVYELQPFSLEDTERYFGKAFPDVQIKLELQEKIYHLSNGNPVLIAIAGEWLKQHIDLPIDISLSLEALREHHPDELQKIQQRFESELVAKVRMLREDIDWAVLYLAYFNRRYDPKILQLVLNFNEKQVQDIFEQLKELVFVRKSALSEGGLLHDEAQRLIREHVWPIVDPDGAMRREALLKVLNAYYSPAIDKLLETAQTNIQAARAIGLIPAITEEELQAQTLKIESLDYKLRLSKREGLEYLYQITDEALQSHSPIFRDAIVQAVHNLMSDPKTSIEAVTCLAEALLPQSQQQALTLARDVLKNPIAGSNEVARALNILGQAAENPQEKIAHFEAALEKAREAADIIRQATFLNNLGQLRRRLGQWAQAEENYRQGLSILGKGTEPNLYANLLNNLAYVVMLRGQLEHADTLAERALRLRIDLGSRPGLAFSYFTKGRIADAKGEYAGALRQYKAAQEWFRSIPDTDNAVWVQVDMAQLERRAERFESAHELLEPALQSTRPDVRAEALSQAAKVAIDEAEALMRREAAPEAWQAVYAQAREYARQAHAAAEALGDAHLQAVEWFDLALVTLLADGRADAEAIPALESLLADHDFPLEQAHLAEHYGALAELAGETEAAFDHYLTACRILAEYSIGRFRRVFERVRARFLDLPPDTQAQVCDRWRPELGSIPSTSPLTALQALCQDDLAEW